MGVSKLLQNREYQNIGFFRHLFPNWNRVWSNSHLKCHFSIRWGGCVGRKYHGWTLKSDRHLPYYIVDEILKLLYYLNTIIYHCPPGPLESILRNEFKIFGFWTLDLESEFLGSLLSMCDTGGTSLSWRKHAPSIWVRPFFSASVSINITILALQTCAEANKGFP
jgi:hypothetical protein